MSFNEFEQARRAFLLKTGVGLGWLSLAELLGTPAGRSSRRFRSTRMPACRASRTSRRRRSA